MAQHNELRKVMQDIVEKLEAMGFALRGDKPKENEWMVRKNSRHSEAGSSLYYFDDEKRPFFVTCTPCGLQRFCKYIQMDKNFCKILIGGNRG